MASSVGGTHTIAHSRWAFIGISPLHVLTHHVENDGHFICMAERASTGNNNYYFNEIHLLFLFFFSPPGSTFVAALSEKQVIDLVWPNALA